jgi:hypothetical protein
MAAIRRLGQFHADLYAVEFRKHVVSCSSFTQAKTPKATVDPFSMPLPFILVGGYSGPFQERFI